MVGGVAAAYLWSQHNSIVELALGYNGLGRLTGDEVGGLGNMNYDVGWGRPWRLGIHPHRVAARRTDRSGRQVVLTGVRVPIATRAALILWADGWW